MKKIILLLLPLSILIGFSSCTMEKRMYRNGWYIDKSNNNQNFRPDNKSEKTESIQVVANDKSSLEEQSIPPTTSTNSASASKNTLAGVDCRVRRPDNTPDNTDPIKKVITKFKQKTTRKLNDPNRMTYAQARKQMAEKGCKPNGMAMAIYYMSWASVVLCWFGLGFILALVTLLLSIFATENVLKEGSCMDENLAIIAAGKRICLLLLIWTAIITVLTFLLILGILALVGGF